MSAAELVQEDSLDVQPAKSTSEPQRGFDRLLSQGFNEQEVQDMRRQFLSLNRNHNQRPDSEDLRDLEDQWIDSTGPRVPHTENANTINEYVEWMSVLAALAGFCLGVVALVLMYIEAGGVFGQKYRISVACGVGVNLAFSILTVLLS